MKLTYSEIFTIKSVSQIVRHNGGYKIYNQYGVYVKDLKPDQIISIEMDDIGDKSILTEEEMNDILYGADKEVNHG